MDFWVATTPLGKIGALIGVLIFSVILIALLTQIPPRFRRPLISVIVFCAGLFFALEYFIPAGPDNKNRLTDYVPNYIDPLSQSLGALMFGVGLFSIMRIHVRNITRQRPGWINSLALILAAMFMAVIAFLARAVSNPGATYQDMFRYLFQGAFQNLDAAMFSLIAFYILSAAYRAFRLRSIESSILMISALIVILGLMPFGSLLTAGLPTEGIGSSFRLESWGQWILLVVSSPSLRAIDFGVGVGALAMALRLWLSIERGALFGDR